MRTTQKHRSNCFKEKTISQIIYNNTRARLYTRDGSLLYFTHHFKSFSSTSLCSVARCPCSVFNVYLLWELFEPYFCTAPFTCQLCLVDVLYTCTMHLNLFFLGFYFDSSDLMVSKVVHAIQR